MLERYGGAVVDERTKPGHLAELSAYLRAEYGPYTGPGYFFAELADGRRGQPRSPRRGMRRLLGTLVRSLKVLVPGNGQKQKAEKVPAPR